MRLAKHLKYLLALQFAVKKAIFYATNVVQMIVDIIDPKPHETVIDPACGSGGFLVVALEHVWTNLEKEDVRRKWDVEQLRKRRSTPHKILSVDSIRTHFWRDDKAYMALIGDGRSGIFLRR